ncbi:MAG: hypothetical protein IKW82_00525 [Bacteroidales bacterium]|jgi:hypothetical protein|nr:hypothetical protein [Bacteroidales bacterium]
MNQEKLISIREKTLNGLKMAETFDGCNKTKLILEVIAKSYAEVLIPNSKEDNEEDKCVRFLYDELNYYIDNV